MYFCMEKGQIRKAIRKREVGEGEKGVCLHDFLVIFFIKSNDIKKKFFLIIFLGQYRLPLHPLSELPSTLVPKSTLGG